MEISVVCVYYGYNCSVYYGDICCMSVYYGYNCSMSVCCRDICCMDENYGDICCMGVELWRYLLYE